LSLNAIPTGNLLDKKSCLENISNSGEWSRLSEKTMKSIRLKLIILGSVILLLIPFIAMQFTNEVNWSLGDFVVAGILLFGTGLLCELVFRRVNNINYRIAICLILLAFFLLIWAELAVGIFVTLFAVL
jgi:hypothetical protein